MPVPASARRPPTRLEYDCRQQMNGLSLLRAVPDRSAAMVHLDPQYRGVLDKLKYGNEGEQRERDRAALPAMSERTIAVFIQEAERVLKPGAHILLWVDKYMLATARHLALFAYAEDVRPVDLFHWNKLRPGMGKRSRAHSEYLVVAQKAPISAVHWRLDRSIPDTWPEMVDRSRHPHTKPYRLLERLVRTLTKRAETIIDPCAGGYTMLDVCQLTGRRFLGCDLISNQNQEGIKNATTA